MASSRRWFTQLTEPRRPKRRETRYVTAHPEGGVWTHRRAIRLVSCLTFDKRLAWQDVQGRSTLFRPPIPRRPSRWLSRRTGGLARRVSDRLAGAPVSNKQAGLARRGLQSMSAKASALWGGVRLIRDELSSAQSGEVIVTATAASERRCAGSRRRVSGPVSSSANGA